MNKIAVSDIDADVRNAASARIEKYKVAFEQIRLIHFLSDCELVFGGAGQLDPELPEYVARKSGTIKAARSRPAIFVTNAD